MTITARQLVPGRGDPVADVSVLQDPASIVGVWQAGERMVTGRDDVLELAPMPLR